MKQTYQTGLKGEKDAEEYLRGKGMSCLERRCRTPAGEIDLIMRDGETVVFVEVKTRRTGAAGTGLAAVDARKQRRVARGAIQYLMSRGLLNVPVRFDVVEISAEGILHIPDAFQPGGMFFG